MCGYVWIYTSLYVRAHVCLFVSRTCLPACLPTCRHSDRTSLPPCMHSCMHKLIHTCMHQEVSAYVLEIRTFGNNPRKSLDRTTPYLQLELGSGFGAHARASAGHGNLSCRLHCMTKPAGRENKRLAGKFSLHAGSTGSTAQLAHSSHASNASCHNSWAPVM